MTMFVDDTAGYDHNQSVYRAQAKIPSNLGSIVQAGHNRETGTPVIPLYFGG